MEPDDADTARWAGLQASIEGEVVLPGSLGYEEVNRPFNARFLDVRPQAVVRCATPEVVAETISFLGRHRLETATRFADPDLDNWAGADYGTNYERLVRVKARFDPGDAFRFGQSLPTR
jgi:FAD/FMN-containing dehydrogenase